jgi:hypothetical protein
VGCGDRSDDAVDLLYAGGRVDPAGCAGWLGSALDDHATAVRMSAALAIARARLPWPPAATTVVVATFVLVQVTDGIRVAG